MKCELAIKNIDQYFNEALVKLDPETIEHLSGCHNCTLYFDEHKKAQEILTHLINFEPVLKEPAGLTDDIMKSLGDTTTDHAGNKAYSVNIFRNIIFRRVLSAAAIILFVLFVYEQFLVLDKVNRLEKRFNLASKFSSTKKDIQIYHSWEFRMLKNYNHIKAHHQEMIILLNSFGKQATLSEMMKRSPGKYAGDTREIIELYKQKMLSPLLEEYLTSPKQNRHEN